MIKRLGFILVILLASFAARQILTGGMRVVSLGQAPPFSGLAAQSLGVGKDQSKVPVAGKDFSLKNGRYFVGDKWVVADIAPLKNNFDPGTVIIQKQNGAYSVVLGPGSDFDSSYLISLPREVGDYLKAKGVIHESL